VTVGELLEPPLGGFRKLVIGSWRIVYRAEARAVRVYAIGRRATVYDDLAERLERSIEERARPWRRRAPAVGRRRPRPRAAT
jgi:hypothetical protein